MTKSEPRQRWSIEKRLEFVDFRLYWEGRINRADLINFFGISVPQASMDLRTYQEAAPDNLRYDKTAKAYVVTESFVPVFFSPSADHFLAQLRLFAAGILDRDQLWIGNIPRFATLPILRRRSEPETLRRILDVTRTSSAMHVRYQSFSHPEPRWRWISPHAFAFDGFRWHVRSWCHERQAFRDFVMARVLEIGDTRPSTIDPTRDVGWNSEVILRIAPHPDMQEGARQSIELDYGMKRGVLEVRTRVCLARYLERHLGLDLDPSQVDAGRQQIVLINRNEVEEAIRAAQVLTSTGNTDDGDSA